MNSPVAAPYVTSPEFPAIIFVNPLAGAGRAALHVPRVREAFSQHSVPATVLIAENSTDLETRARQAIAAGHRFLLAMGGDGTFQTLANAACDAHSLAGSETLLGLLPSGGGNDFATALRLPPNPVAAAHAVLRGQPRCVDLLRARTADGRVRLYSAGGGVGLDAEAARYASGAFRGVPGRLRYVASALCALRGFAPLCVRAEFPDSELPPMEAQVLLAAALNAPTYGAGLHLAPGAQLDNGWLTTVFVKELSARQALGAAARLLARGDLPSAYVQRVRARRVRLTTDRPCMFHGDGEILGPAPVEIEVVPRAVRILAPALP